MKYIAILEDEHIVRIGDKPCLHCFNGQMYDYFIPVKERKKGKWIGTCRIGFGEFADCEVELIGGFVADNCHCSECGEELEKGERGIYCPYCGAEMRGEDV